MYELATVLQDNEYSQMTSSVENYLGTIEHDKVTIAQTAMGLVTSLISKSARQKSMASQNAFSRVWNTVLGKNQKLAVSIIEDEQKVTAASFFLLQKMAERNYMGFELLATLSNRLNMVTAMYDESIQELSLDMNELIKTVNKVFYSAKLKIVELDKRVEKLEQNVHLLKWKNTIEYQSYNGVLYKDLSVATRLLCLLTDFIKITGADWDLYDLLLLKGAFAEIGILGATHTTYRDIYCALLEQPKLCTELLYAMKNESKTMDSNLAEYDIAFVSLLQRVNTLISDDKDTIETIIEVSGSTYEKVAEAMLKKYVINELGVVPTLSLKPFDFILECLQNRKLLLDQNEEKISFESVMKEFEAGEYDTVFPKLIELEKREHSAEIQSMIGVCYYQGQGVEKNEHEAFKWFLLAAEEGDGEAQSLIGVFYRHGKGVEQNSEKAFYWSKLAAEQGDAFAQSQLGELYEEGEGVKQDYLEARKWFLKAAEQGEVDGQLSLARFYMNGNGVPEDYQEAATWYRKAAEQGDAYAQNELGELYEEGKGVNQDYIEARKWFLKAAEQGDMDAQFSLGLLYNDGNGVPKDYAEASNWFEKAAEQGHTPAQNNLAVKYHDGEGVAQDYSKAFYWYKKAADQGLAISQNALGSLFEMGNGVSQDLRKAANWYQQAAEQGDADAQYSLGNLYREGKGVSQDSQEAARWYRKAAEQDHVVAQWFLGFFYEEGEGVSQNFQEAAIWYRKAAEQGNATAQHSLGSLYLEGNGVSQDYQEAISWFWKAAEQGNVHAQSSFGSLYEEGKGVQQDCQKAAAWYQEAADQGNAFAQLSLGALLRDGKGIEQNSVQAARLFKLAADQGISTAAYCLAQLYEDGDGVPRDKDKAKSWYHRAAELGDSDAVDNLNRLNKTTGQKVLGALGTTLAVTGGIAAGVAGVMLGEPHLLAIDSAVGEKYIVDSYQLEEVGANHYQGRVNVTKKGIFGTRGYFNVNAESKSGVYLTWHVALSDFRRD